MKVKRKKTRGSEKKRRKVTWYVGKYTDISPWGIKTPIRFCIRVVLFIRSKTIQQ